MKKKALSILIVCILIGALIQAVTPLFGRKYIPTHDGEYHIIRIVEFSKMLSAGYWFPRWAPTLNSGFGLPIFEFHYPFPNYVGSAIRSVVGDVVLSFQMGQGVGYIVAVAALFGWLVTLFGLAPAIVGTAVGAFVPYWFVDMYVRGSIGEIWATAFLLISLFLIEKKKYILLAFSCGLLILSHNILAMIFVPFLSLYALLRDRSAVLGILGGVGLSAYFWLPALLESKFVVGLNTVNFREHFVEPYELLIPSWGTEFSATGNLGNKMSFQIGIAPISAIVLGILAMRREKAVKKRNLMFFMLIVLGMNLVAMLSFSRSLWEIVRPLQLIQYPWRLLSFVVPVAAFSAAFWVHHIKKQWLGFALAVLAVLLSSSYTRPVLYEPRNEAYYLARQNFTDGTSSMGNSFSTVWTGWKDTRPKSAVTAQNGMVKEQKVSRYLDKEFMVSMEGEGDVTVNTLYFPGWEASVDGKRVPITFASDGIIHLNVAGGDHAIRVVFTDTPARRAGNIISLVSLGVICMWGILQKRGETRA